jgi:hypothetical protein
MHKKTSAKPTRINLSLTADEYAAFRRAAVALTALEGDVISMTDVVRRGLSVLCRDLGIAGADGGAQ